MVSKGKKRLILALTSVLAVFPLSAQQTEQADSLVRLIKAKSIELIDRQGSKFRKALDATFLHNGTYLICDSALWNVDAKIINCEGNVRLIQDETILTSDRLDYLVDEDLAQFRGSLVQLENKKANTLRTRNLDYNTRDSMAIFRGGAAMRDEDGQIIESIEGTYSTPSKLFTFKEKVNMFTDSVFVKTSSLEYDGDKSMVRFTSYIDFWKEGNMLSASSGWYDRESELFFFKGTVHGLTSTQETWSDSLYYHKLINDVELLGNAHVQDSSRQIAGMADRIFYQDSLARITMTGRAAVAVRADEGDAPDTLYFGADKLIYRSVKMCDIPETSLAASKHRLDEINSDVIASYRKRMADEAAAARKAAEAEKEKAKGTANVGPKKGKAETSPDAAKLENVEKSAVEPALEENPEGGEEQGEEVASEEPKIEEPDTTKVGFLTGIGQVKLFRKDMQVVCDSLEYTDLDSIACFFKSPVVWNEISRQYSSDSLFVLVKDRKVTKASLMSNAFIATKETEKYFDQIKGTDIMVFFDDSTQLKRFDALGGISALFYLEENDEIATVNKVEAKMLSSWFVEGQLDKVHYYDSPKNNAYPVVLLSREEHQLKGFDWKPDLRPKSRWDISTLSVKEGERSRYEARPHATFVQTEIYFPGYMNEVYSGIELAKQRKKQNAEKKEKASADSSALSVPLADTLLVAPKDSLKNIAPLDVEPSDTVVKDSSSVSETLPPGPPSKKELRETARKLRIAKRDAKWAEKDARDAEKAAAKAAKVLKRKREMTRRAYIKQQRILSEEQKWLDRYVEKYRKQKDKKHEGDKKTNGGHPVLGSSGDIDGDRVLSRRRISGAEGRPGL